LIALDTNILVRLLLHDDDAQARAAERLVVRARRDRTSLFVADVVLCEVVWVLSRRAGIDRSDIADALDLLFRTELITLEDTAIATHALEAYRVGKGDFADYLIREKARTFGTTEVVTFDRALKADDGFRVIGT
jgi:predicted nucleic-acid-binding protein